MGSILERVAGVEPPRIGMPFEQVLDDAPVEALPALVAALLADPGTLSAWVHAAAEPEPGDPAVRRGWLLERARAEADARVALAAALARVTCWAAARQAEVLVDGAARYDAYLRQVGLPLSLDAAAVEYGAALRVPAAVMTGRIDAARDLTRRFPGTLAALSDGAVSPQHVAALQDLCAPLPDEVAAAVEARVLPRAPRQTVTLFRDSIRRAIARLDTDGAARRHRHAVQTERGVTYRRLDDGMAAVTAILPAPEALTVMGFLDATARVLARAATGQIPAVSSDRGDDAGWFTGPEARERGIRWAQRRADALVLCASAVCGDPALIPSLMLSEPVRPVIHIQVSAQTLARLADHPGELDGYGPIPAELARILAADGAWARDTTGVDGELLETAPPALPAQPAAPRIRHRPRPHLPRPRLQPPGTPLRPRPRPPLQPRRARLRRPHHLRQPALPVPTAPQSQNPSRLPHVATTRRRHRHQDTPRPHLPQRTRTTTLRGLTERLGLNLTDGHSPRPECVLSRAASPRRQCGSWLRR